MKTPKKDAIPAGSSAGRPNGLDGGGGGGGTGGFGGGTGASGYSPGGSIEGGSGGDAMGGAIFVRTGASLTITGNALFDNNQLMGGRGQAGVAGAIIAGAPGGGMGADILMMKGSSVILNPGLGHVIRFNGGASGNSIADDSASSSVTSAIPAGQGAGLTVASGLVVFNGSNTYSGETTITGGVLQADDTIGINYQSRINFAGGVLQSNGSMTLFNRYLGTASTDVEWTGDGGFAATGTDLVVNLNNNDATPVTVTWNSGSFVPNGNKLLFGSTTADALVTFRNPINLAGGNRTILVTANDAMAATLELPEVAVNVDHAILTGVLSNGALTVGDTTHKGMLILTNANTYAGGTTVAGGSLVLAKSYMANGTLLTTGSLNANGAVTVDKFATFDFSQTGNQAIGSLAGGGKVDMGGNTLTINQSTNTTFSGVLADGGIGGGTGASLIKQGLGNLTLSGDNTYTGTTDIKGGTVTLSGSLVSETIHVALGATLTNTAGGLSPLVTLTNDGTVNQDSDDTIDALVNTGTINNSGFTLTAATYALNAGSVINANLGTGTVTANGAVALNGTSAAAIFNVVSGTTTLGSAERLLDTTDLTISSAGTLVLGGVEKIGSLLGAGSLNNNGFRLTVDDGNFSGVVSGSGGLTKLTSGLLTLSGNNIYTGSTLIDAGMLHVGGTLNSANIDVASGATLQVPNSDLLNYDVLGGYGLVDTQGAAFINRSGSTVSGFLTFNGNFINEGVLASGNSPGLTTFGANYTETANLNVELETTTPITGHDQTRVTGSVTVTNTANLIVQTYNNVLPARGAAYQVIANAIGGSTPVSGAFGSVKFDADGDSGSGAPVVNAAVLFDQATGRVLATGLNQANSTFADLGNNQSQSAAAAALLDVATDAVGPNQINTSTLAGEIAAKVVGSASSLARFTPDYYGALADYALAGELQVTNLLRHRVSTLSGLPGQPADGFSCFSGVAQHQADTADQADISRLDIYAGGDYAIAKNVSLGLIVTSNNGDFSATYGKADVNGLAADAYFMAKLNPQFDLYGRVGYGSNNYDLRRTTTDAVQATGSTDSNVFTGSIGVTYAGWTWGALSLAPMADLTYSHVSVDGFTEQGANDSLILGGYDATNLIAQLGASLVWSTKLNGHQFSAELNLGIEQALINDQDNQAATMVNAPVSFYQSFADDDNTRAAVGLRIGYDLTPNTTIYGGYEGYYSSNSSNNFDAGIRVNF